MNNKYIDWLKENMNKYPIAEKEMSNLIELCGYECDGAEVELEQKFEQMQQELQILGQRQSDSDNTPILENNVKFSTSSMVIVLTALIYIDFLLNSTVDRLTNMGHYAEIISIESKHDNKTLHDLVYNYTGNQKTHSDCLIKFIVQVDTTKIYGVFGISVPPFMNADEDTTKLLKKYPCKLGMGGSPNDPDRKRTEYDSVHAQIEDSLGNIVSSDVAETMNNLGLFNEE